MPRAGPPSRQRAATGAHGRCAVPSRPSSGTGREPPAGRSRSGSRPPWTGRRRTVTSCLVEYVVALGEDTVGYFTQPYTDSHHTSTLAAVSGRTTATDGDVQ